MTNATCGSRCTLKLLGFTIAVIIFLIYLRRSEHRKDSICITRNVYTYIFNTFNCKLSCRLWRMIHELAICIMWPSDVVRRQRIRWASVQIRLSVSHGWSCGIHLTTILWEISYFQTTFKGQRRENNTNNHIIRCSFSAEVQCKI